MSHAWETLRLAVHKLAQSGSRRERLAEAFTKYLHALRPKDLPLEVRKDFAKLKEDIHINRAYNSPDKATDKFESIDDTDVGLMIDSIIDIYDAVTRYQPILVPTPTPNPTPASTSKSTSTSASI